MVLHFDDCKNFMMISFLKDINLNNHLHTIFLHISISISRLHGDKKSLINFLNILHIDKVYIK